ncbi:hypothetical protein MLD38_007128 [Melastoma candidum]|uniref:Uncharacterized protein n=1 Tax=Melastoma candidum TaxID=119954 RepID=A0ACB9RQ91_9MYRT|nr:hypothetical protein MLD38_007128 [Melastoma candidum]
MTTSSSSSSANPVQASQDVDSRGRGDDPLLLPLLLDVTADFPVHQVALTVPAADDPSLPSLTFRSLLLGVLSCLLLSFLNQFFWFRRQPLSISSVAAQVAVLPLGHILASGIVTRRVFLRGTRWEFCLNPGRFNMKEHVLISIFASCGAGSVYAVHVVAAVKVFYKREMSIWVGLLVVLTTQVLGFGWAGMFRKYLVVPGTMWWPQNLVQVSLFRALHEKEERPNGGLSRNQFFILAFICSFCYYVLPGYLFPMLTSLSWICWLFPQSVTAQQIGSGLHGLGAAAIGLDWSTMSSYLGSPLASPWFATANVAVGFFIVTYVITPIAYWLNVYSARTFPIFSDGLFTSTGDKYNISAIVDKDFRLDLFAYEQEGPLHLSTFFAMYYGISFACLTATVVHVLLFHGREIWEMSQSALNEKAMDVHTRLMRRYKEVPEWWFTCVLLLNVAATMFVCEYFNDQLQLRWWGILLACGLAIFFTLPVGVITATTNQTPALNVITEYIIGYISPGYPVANILFKVYGYISVKQGIGFLQDFKLGHYMKIPPREMFMAQVLGTIISAIAHLGTAWWLIETIPDICNREVLPSGSPWTCPGDHVFYDASVVWGLIGPRRIFGDQGHYSAVNWFFLLGAVSPLFIWVVHKTFPEKQWIRLISMPVLLGAIVNMPPATAVNYTSWITVGFLSGYVAYRYYRGWWSRHNYLLSGALDAGLAFMGVLLYLCLGMEGVELDWWGGAPDGCPLATCPTAQGVFVKGCPAS